MEYELQIKNGDAWKVVHTSDSCVGLRNMASNAVAEYRIVDGLRERPVNVSLRGCNSMGRWRRLDGARRDRAARIKSLIDSGYTKPEAIALADGGAL
jgi:hypothetical protein